MFYLNGIDDGLRNYECFPSSHLPHAKCSPWKGNPQPHAKCPSWKGKAQPHAKCPSWKGKAQPHAKCPPWKGKAQPHAKCSLPERDSLPIDFMLE